MATLLEMINSVQAQSGFLELDAISGNTDPDVKQLLAIANRAQREIRDYYFWPQLRKTIDISLNTDQFEYGLPDDFRSLVPDSVWELDGNKPAQFPVPDSQWYMYRFSGFSTGGCIRIKRVGSNIQVQGQNDGDDVSLEYISHYAIKDSNDLLKESFTDDNDTWLLDDRLLELGIQAHWAETKMLPQAGRWYANYMNKMSEAIGRSEGSQIIGGCRSHSGRGAPYYPLFRSS